MVFYKTREEIIELCEKGAIDDFISELNQEIEAWENEDMDKIEQANDAFEHGRDDYVYEYIQEEIYNLNRELSTAREVISEYEEKKNPKKREAKDFGFIKQNL